MDSKHAIGSPLVSTRPGLLGGDLETFAWQIPGLHRHPPIAAESVCVRDCSYNQCAAALPTPKPGLGVPGMLGIASPCVCAVAVSFQAIKLLIAPEPHGCSTKIAELVKLPWSSCGATIQISSEWHSFRMDMPKAAWCRTQQRGAISRMILRYLLTHAVISTVCSWLIRSSRGSQ